MQSSSAAVLDFYSRPGRMTSAGRYAPLFDVLPADVAELTRVVQGIVVYDIMAAPFYGFALPDERQSEIHIRPLEELVSRVLALDDRELSTARTAHKRLAGRCRHYTLFLTGILRAKGIPARARCGFGAYFNPGYFEDHWVCEYWNADEQRWILVDAQLDEVWRERLPVQVDPLDVPRNQFLVAADAWERCRRGGADAAKFGIEIAKLRGLWFVAGSLVLDLAALNKVEMLPWDVWGPQRSPDQPLREEQCTLFDRLAALTSDADASFEPLRALYEQDDGLRVPASVFNALLNRMDGV